MAIVQRRWNFLHQPIYSAAHALNPTFMREGLTSTVVVELDEILLLFSVGSVKFSDLKLQWEQFREYDGPGFDDAESTVPHEWWHAHGRK
jgi:hypothetical protein